MIGKLPEAREFIRPRVAAELIEGRVGGQPGEPPRREEARRRCLTSLEEHVAVQIIAADRPVEPPPRIGDEPRFLDESLPDTLIEKIERKRQTDRPVNTDLAQPVPIPGHQKTRPRQKKSVYA